jgi:hypothetical protein
MGTTMRSKLLCLALTAWPPLHGALVAAFTPLQAMRIAPSSTVVAGVVTGPQGKPASSPEEDLFLTLKVIMDHDARSATVSREQFIFQFREAQKVPKSIPPADVAVPYDAAAKLAYEKTDRSVPFREFATKYEKDAIQLVKAKKGKSARTKTVAPASALLASASRRGWSLASRRAASMTRLGSATARRLYGACQKIARQLAAKQDKFAAVARDSRATLTSTLRKVWSVASRRAASMTRLGSATARRLYGACQKVVWNMKLRGR